jgi:CRP/FNR family cyclic AMP-dependent transcriptional regulator
MSRPTDTLAGIPLFRSLAPEELAALSARCLWRRVEAGQWIIDYEDEGTDVFFVLAGQVRVTIRAISGRAVILRDIPSGEFFGEMAAIDGKARSAGIVAVTGATVARMPAPLFRECIHHHPDVCDQVLRLLTGEIRKLATRVNEFNTLDVRHRIYAELLRLARADERGGAVVSPPPPHADLAARVGTRREAVSRVLSALEKEGLLEKRRGALVLPDPGAIEDRVRRAAEDE